MEFRGHDNAVEVVVFAPVHAYAAIRELAGLSVRETADSKTSHFRESVSQGVDKNTRPGAYIATGGRDKLIKLWDTQNGQLIRTFVRRIYLSPGSCAHIDRPGWSRQLGPCSGVPPQRQIPPFSVR